MKRTLCIGVGWLVLGCTSEVPTGGGNDLDVELTPADANVEQEPTGPLVQGPAVPDPVMWFEPMDRSTDVGATRVRIGVEVPNGSSHDLGVLEELAASVLLEADSGEVVRSVVSVQVEPGASARRAFVEVTPAAALVEGWYQLSVRPPEGISLPRFSWHHEAGSGRVGSRFAVGSDPKIVAVRVCERGTFVDVSEPVDGAEHRAPVRVSGCTAVSRSEDAASEREFAFDCGDGGPSELELHVDRYVTSLSGRAFSFPGAGAEDRRGVRADELVPWGDTCLIRRF